MAKRSNEETSDVDLDIGHFVISYDFLKEQLDKLSVLLRVTDSLRRWEVPSLTLLCCVFVTTLCIFFPEFLLAVCLSLIPLTLLVTGIKNLGQKNQKQVKHIVVIAVENDEETLKKKKERTEKATKDLRRFIKIICELQHLMKEINKRLVFVQSLFSWEDPQQTLRFMGYVFTLMFLFSFIPIYLILLIGFLIVFLKNEDFVKVVLEYLSVLEVKHCENETHLNDQTEYNVKWHDACGAAETDDDSNSYEDNSNQSEDESTEELFDQHVDQSSSKCQRSFVKHISEYRKRRQELNKGNCAACDVAFSSLLTRRKYCRRCGDKFCSKCCRHYVTKAALGATAPGSRDQRVLVCNDCHKKLRV